MKVYGAIVDCDGQLQMLPKSTLAGGDHAVFGLSIPSIEFVLVLQLLPINTMALMRAQAVRA